MGPQAIEAALAAMSRRDHSGYRLGHVVVNPSVGTHARSEPETVLRREAVPSGRIACRRGVGNGVLLRNGGAPVHFIGHDAGRPLGRAV